MAKHHRYFVSGVVEKDLSQFAEKKVLPIAHKVAIKGSLELRNAAQKVLSNSPARSGRIYKKPNSKATYRASAPGEAPALRTNTLRASFRTQPARGDGDKWTPVARISSPQHYAAELENGNKRVAPRPYSERVQYKAWKKMDKMMTQELSKLT